MVHAKDLQKWEDEARKRYPSRKVIAHPTYIEIEGYEAMGLEGLLTEEQKQKVAEAMNILKDVCLRAGGKGCVNCPFSETCDLIVKRCGCLPFEW